MTTTTTSAAVTPCEDVPLTSGGAVSDRPESRLSHSTPKPACKRQYGTTERGTSTSTTQQDKLAEPLAGNKTASTQGGAEELGLLQLVNHQIDERIAAMEKTLTQTSLGS
ncbi:hypothetical protein Pelo_17546 [Pelomyxa schiedti]|nr:hypothetical protein Pelo_17546 [Pelomyxa schiedti]